MYGNVVFLQLICVSPFFVAGQKAMNVVHAIKKMRMLTFEHGSDSESSPNASPSSKRKVAESATAGAQSN